MRIAKLKLAGWQESLIMVYSVSFSICKSYKYGVIKYPPHFGEGIK